MYGVSLFHIVILVATCLLLLRHIMPQSKRAKRNNRKGGGGKGGSAGKIDRLLVNSQVVVGKAFNNFPAADLERPIPNWSLTQHPPSLRNNITWVVGHTQVTQTISNSVPTEVTFPFRFSDCTDLVGLASFFDQYCLYSVVWSCSAAFEGAGSALYSFGSVATCIDYDNASNLGSQANYLAYQSCVVEELSAGQSIQRFVKPCVSPAFFSSAPAFSGFGVGRYWVDSSNTGVPHYGIRSFFTSNTVSGAGVAFDLTYVIGLRNNI